LFALKNLPVTFTALGYLFCESDHAKSAACAVKKEDTEKMHVTQFPQDVAHNICRYIMPA
jgi:hypothetical protein